MAETINYKEKYETLQADKEAVDRARRDDKQEFELKTKKLEAEHEIALLKKQSEIDLFESKTIKQLETDLTEADKKLAVAETKLEFMEKLTDVNADVLDVKDLVTKLIEKLPSVNINSIIAGLQGAVKTEDK